MNIALLDNDDEADEGDDDDDCPATAAALPAIIEQLVQCIGGFGTDLGAGASCHLLAANSVRFGGDDDTADDDDDDEPLLLVLPGEYERPPELVGLWPLPY